MSMKIEGSNVAQVSCQSEVPVVQVQQAAPLTCTDRVESVSVEARQPTSELEQRLLQTLRAVPSPGAMELEVSGRVMPGSALAKVTADRDAAGEFVVRVHGKAQGALGTHHLAAELGASGTAVYRARTPEAAAQLLTSLQNATSTAQADQQLLRVEGAASFDLHLSAQLGALYSAAEFSQHYVGAIDFEKRLLVVEQAGMGEATQRTALLLGRAGQGAELALKLRTETQLPPETLTRLANGELSIADVLQHSESTRKLIVEGHRQHETVSAWGGAATVEKLEAELDLDALTANPLEPLKALKGERTTLTSVDTSAYGVGADLHVGNFQARSAIYSVSTSHLFQDHGPALQQELDARRALTQ